MAWKIIIFVFDLTNGYIWILENLRENVRKIKNKKEKWKERKNEGK